MIWARTGGLRIGADHIADVDQMLAHLAVEGRAHFGVADVQLGERDLRLGGLDIGLGGLLFENPVIHFHLGGRVLPEQGGVTADFQFGVVAGDRRGLELGLRLLKLGLVLVLLDDEEQIVLGDDGAVLEMDLLEIAGDARDQADLIDRRRIADDLQSVAHRLDFRRHDRNGRRRRRRLSLRQGGRGRRRAEQGEGGGDLERSEPAPRGDTENFFHRDHHCGGLTVGPRSDGPGSPGVGGAFWPAGGSSSPQLVRARISSRTESGTKSRPHRICQPPPSAR